MPLTSLYPGLISPDKKNLIIPKGFALIKPSDDAQKRHMGNMPSVTFTPAFETLEHFDSMAGIKTKDETITLSQGGAVKFSAEEFTFSNLRMMIAAAMPDLTDLTNVQMNIFEQESIVAEWWWYSTNKKGPRWYWHFNQLTFIPAGDISLVGDAYGNLPVTGSVESVDGAFGTVTLKPPVDSVAPEFVLDPYLFGQNPTEEGDLLTVARGGVIGNTEALTFVWKKAGSAITGPAETGQTYVVRSGDDAAEITCTVTATNNVGATSVTTPGITIGTSY
jgi:hypothetical protein